MTLKRSGQRGFISHLLASQQPSPCNDKIKGTLLGSRKLVSVPVNTHGSGLQSRAINWRNTAE